MAEDSIETDDVNIAMRIVDLMGIKYFFGNGLAHIASICLRATFTLRVTLSLRLSLALRAILGLRPSLIVANCYKLEAYLKSNT